MTSRTWTVVICAYTDDRWPETVDAVESVLAQTFEPDEVLVVVDHNPALFDRLSDRFDGRVRVVVNRHVAGLSGARNTGIEDAGGTHVAFLDDDAVAIPGWLAMLDRPFEGPGVVGVAGGVFPRWATERPSWFPDEFLWVVGCSYPGMPGAGQPIRNPIGANMALERSQMLAVGGFDPRLGRTDRTPSGCEETDIAIRIRRSSLRTFIHEPSARVDHKVAANRTTWAYFRRRCLAEGRSKAELTKGAGFDDATASERRYVTQVLLGGVIRRVRGGAGRPNGAALSQAAAIAVGLAFTTVGFGLGLVSNLATPSTSRSPLRPAGTVTPKEKEKL